LCTEELHGEGNYTFEDDVQGSSSESSSNSKSKERNEDGIREGVEEVRT
jgi:hypothetical protein